MGSQVQARRLSGCMLGLCCVALALPAMGQGDPIARDAGSSEAGADSDAAEIAPPELVQDVQPDYPAGAMAADVEADVVLQIDIDELGAVSNIVPLELTYYTYSAEGAAREDPRAVDADEYGFVASALAAMAQYRFLPARAPNPDDLEGTPIPVRVTWRIGFVIDYEEVVVPSTEIPADVSGPAAGGESAAAALVDPDAPTNLEGVLLNRGTREPLGSLYVRATSLIDGEVSAETLSAADGTFGFAGLSPGRWRVQIDEVGFYPVSSTEDVVPGQVTSVVYYVERNDFGEYSSITIAEAPRREVTRRTIEVTEIQRIPGNNNDAIRVVQNLPGVARSQFNGGDVIVRGSEAEDTGFYLDGLRLPAIYHFGGLRAVVPTELLEDINFYPGAFPVDFGRATGGIIDVRTRRDIPDRTTGHIDMNVFDSGFFVRTPISDSVGLELGARRSYIDAILAPLAGPLGLNFATAPRWYDYQLRLTWQIDDRNTLRILALGSDDKIDFVLDDEESLDPIDRGGVFAQTWFHGARASLHTQVTDTVEHEVHMQLQWQSLQFEFGQESFFDLKTRVFSFRDQITWAPSDALALRYGVDIETYPGDLQLRLPRPPKEGEEPVDFQDQEQIEGDENFAIYWPAHYLGLELEPIEGLRILPGVRNEYYRPTEQWAVDGRLALRWAALERLTLKAAVSNHHQSPNPEETSAAFGNPDIRLETAVHYVAGVEVQLLEFLSANVELFFKDLDNVVARSERTVEREGEVVPQIYNNAGEGRVYGMEFLLRHDLANNFFGWVAYTLSRSERLDPGAESYRLFDFDQTHILTALGSYNLPRNWSLGARFRLVSGNPTTPIDGAVYDSDTDSYARVPGESNSERLPAFHQLDVRVDKRWVRDRWTANLYLDLQNFYNRKNAEGISYNYDFTESARITGLPLIPAFGFRAEW